MFLLAVPLNVFQIRLPHINTWLCHVRCVAGSGAALSAIRLPISYLLAKAAIQLANSWQEQLAN